MFSVSPKALDAIKSLKSRIANQRNLGSRDVYVSPAAIAEELQPFTLSSRLGESPKDYAMRAYNKGLLTDVEVKFLIQKELGYIGTAETKNKIGAHENRADELRKEGVPEEGNMVAMRPFLVNISWTYGGSGGASKRKGSSPVKYSIEGIFYGWDAELTMEAGREFLMSNMANSSKAMSIMDIGDFNVSIDEDSQRIAGAMEVSGEIFNKRYGEVIDDDRFTTRINAFFEHPENRRLYTDKEFRYSDSPIRYRWIENRIVMD